MVCADGSQFPSILPQQSVAELPTAQMTLFCDLDGPLVDVSERYYQTYLLSLAETQAAYRAWGEALTVSPLSKQQFWAMKQTRTPDTEIALRSGLQVKQIEFFIARVRQTVNQPSLLQQDQLQPGVCWSLALLHAWGVRLAVVTLRCQAQAEQILQNFGIAHFFVQICGTQDDQVAYCNYAECKRELLANVMAQEALGTEQMWMIGDTEADVLAGQAMGLPTIALTCGIRSRDYLHQLAPTRIHGDLLSATHYLLGLA